MFGCVPLSFCFLGKYWKRVLLSAIVIDWYCVLFGPSEKKTFTWLLLNHEFNPAYVEWFEHKIEGSLVLKNDKFVETTTGSLYNLSLLLSGVKNETF